MVWHRDPRCNCASRVRRRLRIALLGRVCLRGDTERAHHTCRQNQLPRGGAQELTPGPPREGVFGRVYLRGEGCSLSDLLCEFSFFLCELSRLYELSFVWVLFCEFSLCELTFLFFFLCETLADHHFCSLARWRRRKEEGEGGGGGEGGRLYLITRTPITRIWGII